MKQNKKTNQKEQKNILNNEFLIIRFNLVVHYWMRQFISDVEREKYKSGASSGTFILPSRGANIGSIPRTSDRNSTSLSEFQRNTSCLRVKEPLFLHQRTCHCLKPSFRVYSSTKDPIHHSHNVERYENENEGLIVEHCGRSHEEDSHP